MTMENENERARAAAKEERAKLGGRDIFSKTGASHQSDDDEERMDMGDLDDDEEETNEDADSEESEEESEDEQESSEDDETDEDEDEESESHDGKIPKSYLEKEKAKRNKLKQQNADLRKQLEDSIREKEEIKGKLPDDLDLRIQELATEIGIEDSDKLAKMINFIKEVGGKDIPAIQAQLAELQKDKQKQIQQQSFQAEFQSFRTDLETEYPNATKDQIEKVEELMDRLSHAPGIGGIPFKDTDGIEKLNPYPLKYIFFSNRDQFDALVNLKKRKGLEINRSPKLDKADDKPKRLPKNATVAQIRQREKELADLESGGDGLRTPEDREL